MRGVKTWVVYARKWIQALRWLVLALLIVAMARPQKKWFEENGMEQVWGGTIKFDNSTAYVVKGIKK